MQFATLDIICRRSLLEKGLPIHFYLEYLLHSSACIRELNKDTLQIINSVRLKINDYRAADLPGDFMDDVAVCIPTGGELMPIPHSTNLNPIRIHSTTSGQFVPYPDAEEAEDQTFYGFPAGWMWFWNVSDWGEPTGRYFGATGGDYQNGYQVFKQRRQIQFTGTFPTDNVVLLYISNGQSIDNASQVDWQAHSAIQSFCEWKRSPNADIKDSYEAMTYYNEKRLLRAALNPLTCTDIRNILHKAYTATIKT